MILPMKNMPFNNEYTYTQIWKQNSNCRNIA